MHEGSARPAAAGRYERVAGRGGYGNCTRERTLTGPKDRLTSVRPWVTVSTPASADVIERPHEKFQRRVKTHALLTEDAAVTLPFRLVANGRITLHRIDAWQKVPALLHQLVRSAA